MNVQKQILTIETKAKLFTLWLLFLLNIIFRDIHEFVEPGFVEEIMTRTNPAIEQMLLLSGVMIEIPISMIFFSWVLPYRANRWANILIAAIYISIVGVVGTTDLDDTFHLIAEIAALSLVIWSAVRWRSPFLKRHIISQEVSS